MKSKKTFEKLNHNEHDVNRFYEFLEQEWNSIVDDLVIRDYKPRDKKGRFVKR